MNEMSGLGKLERKQLVEVIRGTKGSITVTDAVNILQVSSSRASMKLSNWARKGWLSRVQRGLYVPVPLESFNADTPVEDPWIIVERMFKPCYIGGWTAIEHWDLTEQIFRTVFVMTTQKIRKSKITVSGIQLQIKRIDENFMFGLKPVWRGQVKVMVSDPSRTIIDFLKEPSLGGGIRSIADVIKRYLKSEYNNPKLLLEYASRLNKGSVFKRLGFLFENIAPEEKALIAICKKNIKKGNNKLDPKLPADNLITKWGLWVPVNWKPEA